jgi:serine/threonine-protein kinase RsbW
MSEFVSMSIPSKAEHLLVVRLAASGICSRLGMGIEKMEDVKAAVAEACLIMINDQAGYGRLAVSFEYGDQLCVTVAGENPGGQAQGEEIDAEFSLTLLQALTDRTELGQGFVRFSVRGGAKR